MQEARLNRKKEVIKLIWASKTWQLRYDLIGEAGRIYEGVLLLLVGSVSLLLFVSFQPSFSLPRSLSL